MGSISGDTSGGQLPTIRRRSAQERYPDRRRTEAVGRVLSLLMGLGWGGGAVWAIAGVLDTGSGWLAHSCLGASALAQAVALALAAVHPRYGVRHQALGAAGWLTVAVALGALAAGSLILVAYLSIGAVHVLDRLHDRGPDEDQTWLTFWMLS